MLQGALENTSRARPTGMLLHPRSVHKGSVRQNHMGYLGRRMFLFWPSCGGSGLCPGGTLPTDSVRNANLVQRATFPWKWMTHPTPDNSYQAPPAGTPPTHWETPPGVAPGATPPGNPRTPKKTDPHHPKIKQLMDPYLKRYNGYVNLGEILTSSGKRMSDLPTLPQYCSARGESLICWNSVLGTCF